MENRIDHRTPTGALVILDFACENFAQFPNKTIKQTRIIIDEAFAVLHGLINAQSEPKQTKQGAKSDSKQEK